MDSTVQKKLHSIHQLLENILADVFTEGKQIAVWRKPNSNFLQIVIDNSGRTKKVPLQLEELKSGFIVHPFEDQEDRTAYFIEAENYFKIDLDAPLDQQNDLDAFGNEISSAEVSQQIKKSLFEKSYNDFKKGFQETQKQDFIDIVNNGIQAVKSGHLDKIVPARIKKIDLSEDFDVVRSFLKLLNAYPNAFINFFHLPEIGTWIGASPEILIQTKGDEFYTMSVAGTQKASGENPLKTVAWTQKEIEEQALVSRYIVDCFKKIRLREYEERGPKTVLAGNLLHLRSDFHVDMKETNFPLLGSVMLNLLHPTSAVCGMPRKEALEFLEKHEKFDRFMFSGFIGPVNIEQETSIYVNLRTARLMNGAAFLWAGAGVTEDSNPEKEWEETEMKCEVIAKHLNPIQQS